MKSLFLKLFASVRCMLAERVMVIQVFREGDVERIEFWGTDTPPDVQVTILRKLAESIENDGVLTTDNKNLSSKPINPN